MNKENTRMLVIGAGVNGSVCATGLHQAGVDVTVLARGQRYEELRDDGIVIENPMTRKRSVTKVPVINTLDPHDCYDYILVIVRRNQVAALLPALAQNESPSIVFMGNNLSSPDEYTAALGKQRVLLGFVFGSGKREGSVIWAIGGSGMAATIAGRLWPTPFGEIDGATTPRLMRLVGIFRRAGFNAATSPTISDYLATHAMLVALVVCLFTRYNGDPSALAASPADLRLLIEAMREAFDVLHACGRRVTPRSLLLLKLIPRFLLVAAVHALLPTKFMEVIGSDYAPSLDEMAQFAEEIEGLVEQAGLAVPAIRNILRTDKRDRKAP